jgi:hypothetical protein
MTTVRSMIVKGLPEVLSTVYQNNSGGNATLKAINMNGGADANVFTADTVAGDDWTFLGSSSPVLAAGAPSSNSYGMPMTVRLSADRLLLVWLPHHTHIGGGADFMTNNTLHCQIVEWTGTKYRAGPITNVILPTANASDMFKLPSAITSSTVGQHAFKFLALTPTKVALVYRTGTVFRAMRIDIVGNTVSNAAAPSLDLTGAGIFNTTSGVGFDIAATPGNTNKMLIAGAGSANFTVAAFNFPDSGAITLSGAVFSTGLANSTFAFAFGQLNRVAVGNVLSYVMAYGSSATTFSIQNISYNHATDNFLVVGTPAPMASVTIMQGLSINCLSGDSTANAVVACIDSALYSTVRLYRQTSLTQASNTVTTLVTQHASLKSINRSFDWGNDRAVFSGEGSLLMVVDNAGTATNLLAGETTDTVQVAQQWFPFDNRPLYSIYDTTTSFRQSRVPQLYARTGAGVSGTGLGSAEVSNTYLPYGHVYGGDHSWSDKLECWVIGFGGKLYFVGSDGVTLAELSLYQLGAAVGSNPLLSIKQVSVTPSGKVVFGYDYVGSHVSFRLDAGWANNGTFCAAAATAPLLSITDVPKAVLAAPATALVGNNVIDMVTFVDYLGVERAYMLTMQAATNAYIRISHFDGASWYDIGNTSITSAALNSGWNIGARAPFRLMQVDPCDASQQTGKWRIIGVQGTNSAVNATYLGISSVAYNIASFTSLNTSQSISTTAAAYSLVRSTVNGMSMVAVYDPTPVTGQRIRQYITVQGRLYADPIFGWAPSLIDTADQLATVGVSKYVVAVSTINTGVPGSVATNTPVNSYIWDTMTPWSGPRITLVGTSGAGYGKAEQVSRFGVKVYGPGIANRYRVVGQQDVAKVSFTINDGTNDFYLTPKSGQPVSTNPDQSYRSAEAYLIPDGYSVKAKAEVGAAIDAMLSIVEEV